LLLAQEVAKGFYEFGCLIHGNSNGPFGDVRGCVAVIHNDSAKVEYYLTMMAFPQDEEFALARWAL